MPSDVVHNALLRAAANASSPLLHLMTWHEVGTGDTLIAAGSTPQDVFLPESAVLSFVCELGDGKALEVASVGRNGSTAALTMLGGAPSVSHVVVSVPGRVARVSMRDFLREIEASPALRDTAARHVREVFQQTQRSTVCAALHPVEGRVATWLLVTSDRAGHGEITVAHHTIARMLGVRRASVSDVATRLRSRGLIDYVRGSFRVLDADALRATACCCHEITAARSDVSATAEASAPAASSFGVARLAPNIPMASAERDALADVKQRVTVAREALSRAVKHCATFIRHSQYRINKPGCGLDESERVVQHLRSAVEFYGKALRADNKPVEVAITLITRLVDEADVAPSDRGLLRAAAAQWATDALNRTPARRHADQHVRMRHAAGVP